MTTYNVNRFLVVFCVWRCYVGRSFSNDKCQVRCKFGDSCWPSDIEISAFKASLAGTVYLSYDSFFTERSKMKNKRVTKDPALLVNPNSTEDVQKTLLFAKHYNMTLAVRSWGHSNVGRSTVEDGIIISLFDMKRIDVNTTATHRSPGGEVTVESGNSWVRVYEEVHKYDRIVVGGSDHNVGMGGYTLGGGHSPISRNLGLAVDNLLEATLITASDGQVTVSADGTKTHLSNGSVTENRDTDLFWALRGGGGSVWGIVTSFTFKLHVPPSGFVYAVYVASWIMGDAIPGSNTLKIH